jgi:hypothetical protein
MKKIALVFIFLLLLNSLVGCSLFDEKIITEEETKIETISISRMNELVQANNDIASTLHGEPMFFNVAELECHLKEFYSKETVDNYVNSSVFYMQDGKLCSSIRIDENRENIAKMQYEILTDTIYFVGEEQSFSVRFYGEFTAYDVNFTVVYSEEAEDWVMTDIAL